MKQGKLSLKSVENVLSRAELKKIMAGSGTAPCAWLGNACVQNDPTAPFQCCSGLFCAPVYALDGKTIQEWTCQN
jgi:hypothetical protein